MMSQTRYQGEGGGLDTQARPADHWRMGHATKPSRTRTSRMAQILAQICFALALPLIGADGALAQERIPRVLLLYPYDNTGAAIISGEAARKRMMERLNRKVEFNSDFLDLLRFQDEAHRRQAAQYLAQKYAQISIDLIIALNTETYRFVGAYRDLFAPKVPVVFCCVMRSLLDETTDRPTDITGIITDYDITKSLDLAERLQPKARDLVFVSGASTIDQVWQDMYRRQAAPYQSRFNVTFLSGLSREELLQRVSRLSPDTIVVLGALFVDSIGRQHIAYELASDVAKASSAPTYAPIDTFLGRGIVGGHMGTFEDAGIEVADLAVEVLGGTDPRSIPPRSSKGQHFRVDARQLARWGMAESALPADALVLFKEPTLWEEHRNSVISALAIMAIQMALIGALVLQIFRRRRLEHEMQVAQSELARVTRVTTMGEMTASIAHEVNQPLAAIVASGSAGLRWLANATPNIEEAKAALKRVVNDGYRASEVISGVRAMFKKDAQARNPVDINQLVREVLTLLQSQIQENDIVVKTSLSDEAPVVPGDKVQLQQVLLNLITNAIEAMANVSGRERSLRISTQAQGGEVLLDIADAGHGIEPEHLKRIFEAFYTTKTHGMGMGLSICKSIVQRHGGRLSASRATPHGSVFHVVLTTSVQD
jgi:signal transduction histidine kinase